MASPPEAKIQFPAFVLVRTMWPTKAIASAQTMSIGTPLTLGAPFGSRPMTSWSASQAKRELPIVPEKRKPTNVPSAASFTPPTIVRLVKRIDSAIISPRRM